MPTSLSPAASDLLHRRLSGERIAATDENRPLFRALVAAGSLIISRPFIGTRRPVWTKHDWNLADVLARPVDAPEAAGAGGPGRIVPRDGPVTRAAAKRGSTRATASVRHDPLSATGGM